MEAKFQRDAVIEKIQETMAKDDSIFFVSADFGAPSLDRLRERFGGRFLNVGIAEQNLINIATGLALEGWKVYAYAIAPFLTMRAFEQIRTNLSILSQVRTVDVTLIGVGVGLSYDVTGPTHHCLEDACLMGVLPNLTILSPCDSVTAERFIDYSRRVQTPKYMRLDGKLQLPVHGDGQSLKFEIGFSELRGGSGVCLVSTGYMTHKALRVADSLLSQGLRVGVIDMFMLKPLCEPRLAKALGGYAQIVTLEEAFLRKGSLDTIISDVLRNSRSSAKLIRCGFPDQYLFEVGNREHLHKLNGLDEDTIISTILRATDNQRKKP